jgi:hypothetical protein
MSPASIAAVPLNSSMISSPSAMMPWIASQGLALGALADQLEYLLQALDMLLRSARDAFRIRP